MTRIRGSGAAFRRTGGGRRGGDRAWSNHGGEGWRGTGYRDLLRRRRGHGQPGGGVGGGRRRGWRAGFERGCALGRSKRLRRERETEAPQDSYSSISCSTSTSWVAEGRARRQDQSAGEPTGLPATARRCRTDNESTGGGQCRIRHLGPDQGWSMGLNPSPVRQMLTPYL